MGVSARWLLTEADKEKYINKLTKELPALRARAGISQGELAYLIGVTRQTFSAIENGKREMSWQAYLSLIFFFDNLADTRESLRVLGIFPEELVARFNAKDGNSRTDDAETQQQKALKEILKIVDSMKLSVL